MPSKALSASKWIKCTQVAKAAEVETVYLNFDYAVLIQPCASKAGTKSTIIRMLDGGPEPVFYEIRENASEILERIAAAENATAAQKRRAHGR